MEEKLMGIWQDPAKEIGELLLDEAAARAHLHLLEKIPLVSIGVAAWKSGHAWADYTLARKVQAFYEGWEKLDGKERRAIFEKFQRKQRDFAQKLLGIITVQEDEQKCRLIGFLTAQYLQDKLHRADFYDMIESIARLSVTDIAKFVSLSRLSIFLPQERVTERYAYLFIGRGLLESDRPPVGTYDTDQEPAVYKLTELGQAMANAAKFVGFGKKARA